MRKKFTATLLLCVCALWGVFSQGWAAEELTLNVKSAVLMDPESGRVLFGLNEHQRFPPASVTKLMTMLIVMEAVDSGKIKWNDKIPTSATASNMGGSQVFLKEGEELSLHDMLKAIAVVSANDASTAVAEYLYGTDQDFIVKMNQRARQLELRDTHFANETGLPDPNHYSSAYDLAVISGELLKHPKILTFTSIWMDQLRGGKFILRNTNELIHVYKGADGLKTGHTDEAKFCLAATAQRNGLRMLSVIMGAPTNTMRVSETRRLLDYGFRNYQLKTVARSNKELGRVSIKNTQPEKIPVKIKSDFQMMVEQDNPRPITTRLEPLKRVKLPLKPGAKIGWIKAFQGGRFLGQTPIYTAVRVKRANIFILGWRALRDLIFNWLSRKK